METRPYSLICRSTVVGNGPMISTCMDTPEHLRPCFHLYVLRAFSVPSPCVLRTWKNRTSWNMNECFHARVVRALSVRSPCSVRIGQWAIFIFADILRIPFYVNMPRSQLSLFETSEKLIELVRLHPCLYNPTLREYKDIDVSRNTWRSIAKALNMPETSCKYILRDWLQVKL